MRDQIYTMETVVIEIDFVKDSWVFTVEIYRPPNYIFHLMIDEWVTKWNEIWEDNGWAWLPLCL